MSCAMSKSAEDVIFITNIFFLQSQISDGCICGVWSVCVWRKFECDKVFNEDDSEKEKEREKPAFL